MSEIRTAAICGTFDVVNFGDLMFPVVANARLARFGWRVVPVSPTATGTGLADAAIPRPMLDLLRRRLNVEAVLIGGGELIHGWSARFLREYAADDLPDFAYLSLWFGAAMAAALADIPLAWNAPGMPAPLKPAARRLLLEPALAASDYVAVRDATSAAFLGRAHAPDIVPDSIASLASVWPKPGLAPAFAELAERKKFPAAARLLAVHLRPERLDAPEIQRFGAALSGFAQAHGLLPVLVAIGPSLDDAVALRDLSRALAVAHVLLDEPRSLREIAAVLAHAALYVGNSLHGYITAAAYDVPGVIVARSGFRKYQGFAAHLGREADVSRGWDRALERAAALLARDQGPLIPAAVHAALDRHFAHMAQAIDAPAAGRARRAAFLREILGHAMQEGGFAGLARLLAKPGAGTGLAA